MFSVWLEIYLVSVCSRCEGKSVMDFLATVKYRRPYAIAVVTDNIVCILASIWRGCRNFELRIVHTNNRTVGWRAFR